MQSRPLKRVVVCLFRNDLRLSDNPVLTQAAAAARSPCPATCSPLLPVYCFDPRQFSGKKTGRFRARFLADSVLALRAELRSRGSDLLLFCGQPEVVVPALLAAAVPSGSGASSLVVLEHLACHEEAETERALEAALPPPRAKTKTLWGAQTLFEPEDLPFSFPDKVPNGFTSMRKKIESSGADVRDPLPVPNLAGLAPSVPVGAEGVPGYVVAGDATTVGLLGLLGFEADDGVVASPPAALAWRGGEQAAVERLEQFCRCGLATYKETRNGSIGPSYSTKMSPWLALGCITPRQIHARVLRFEGENGGQTVHTYWVYFELMWRDFFRFYCAKNGRKVWLVGGPLGATGKEWASGERGAELLEAWRAGRTGVPFVDGHMRELLATGFMSNRGRQNVASFLVHNLKVDWRLGAAHFERLLLDYDPSSNVGNWLAIAGLTGGRVNVFNVAKQAKDYDADANHARLWCPELSGITPGFRVHALPGMGPGEREAMAPGYPAPVCEAPTRWRDGGGKQPRQQGGGEQRGKPRSKGRMHRGRGGRQFVTR